MGQKIHPLGFRVGITKKYQCQWFARFHKYNYAQTILEDHMLRTTLMKIFPELLNPLGKKAQKQSSNSADKDTKLAPKITQIKIERGLIPYEIGIQIYTENAELIKSAIDNLKINTDLFCYLQKTRQYLLKLKQQINLNDAEKQKEDRALLSVAKAKNSQESELVPSIALTNTLATEKGKLRKTFYRNQEKVIEFPTVLKTLSIYKPKIKKEISNKPKGFTRRRNSPFVKDSSKGGKLAKQTYKKKRLIARRLKKRQIVSARYGRFISKGLFVKKTGNSIIRHIFLKSLTSFSGSEARAEKRELKKKNSSDTLAKKLSTAVSLGLSQEDRTSLVTPTNSKFLSKGRTAFNKQKENRGNSLGNEEKQKRLANKQINLSFREAITQPPQREGNKLSGTTDSSLAYATKNSHIKGGLKISYTGIKKKFLSVFINKINKNFLKHLKDIMIYWHNNVSNSNSVILPSGEIKGIEATLVGCSKQGLALPVDSLLLPNSENTSSLGMLKQEISGNIRFAPFGYGQHWSSSRLKQLKDQPISKLTRLVEILEEKSLITMGKLRKHYLSFGFLSKTQGLGYYQIITFLKSIKKLIAKLRQQIYATNQKAFKNKKKNSQDSSEATSAGATEGKQAALGLSLKLERSKASYWKTSSSVGENINTQKELEDSSKDRVFRRKLDNVENQCRKIKFISYLKNIVKTHREQNIFFYLRTIADARKDLKLFKLFTKKYAKLLFGIDLNKSGNSGFPEDPLESSLMITAPDATKIKDHVIRVLNLPEKERETVQNTLLDEVYKQKTMALKNINLMPYISIRFYSIKVAKNFECKASIVADAIIDALEKRKSFRKVIKDAKENLMRTAKVKGVKIQVAGRLNGAEIARAEWVRAGRVPLQTLRANIDYVSLPANTIFGIIGVKVWIFKGYSKLIN